MKGANVSFNLVQWIWDMLNTFAPWIIIKSYERGCRWTLGKNPQVVGPGFVWNIWVVHEIETVSVVPQYIKLPVQSVTTSDGEPVCFSVGIGFQVEDPVQHFCNVTDFDESLSTISEIHLAKRVREQSYKETSDEKVSGLKELESSLKNTLTTKVRNWGTRIIEVGFSNFSHVNLQFRGFGFNTEE